MSRADLAKAFNRRRSLTWKSTASEPPLPTFPDLLVPNFEGSGPINSSCSDGLPPKGSIPDVAYLYYPFLSLGNLANLPPHDVNFPESQGCFRVPIPGLLEQFLRKYFLHVHPLLPLVNEGEFWDAFSLEPQSPARPEGISLLLLQSMLFAASSFVSESVFRSLGYRNVRAIRAALYRRAKLLYNLETESSSILLSQSALLLSHWSPSSSRKINTT